MNLRRRIAIITLLASLSVAPVLADTVSGLTTFTSGAQARAAEVNANYQAIKRAVDDNFSRIGGTRTDIAALQAAVATLQTSVQTLNASNTALQSQIATLTANNTALQSQVSTLSTNIANLNSIGPYVGLTTVNGVRTVRFTGVNLQVVNGLGSTATANGTGNVIVGYDEVGGSKFVCSRGKAAPSATAMLVDDAACVASGGTFGTSHKGGSHYLVTGSQNSYSQWGGIVGGLSNYAVFEYASALGGTDNISSGTASMIAGGREGQAIGEQSTISGGRLNRATSFSASVSGGRANVAAEESASVSGGELNTANGLRSSISGGQRNTASAMHSSVSGGNGNAALGLYSSISGGKNNQASATGSHVSGGGLSSAGVGVLNNNAAVEFSSILGGVNQTTTSAGQTIPALP